MIGKITKATNNKLLIEFEDEINEEYLKLLSAGDCNLAEVNLLDNRRMSQKQNALSHALIADIARFSYDEPIYIESVLKYYYEAKTGILFEHKKSTKQQANEWIDFLIEFVLKNNIPLPKRYNYLLENNSFFYFCCKYRKCAVCGKSHADIHHLKAVGNRHRDQVDHRKLPIAALCREHHNVAHSLGVVAFLEKYKIIPVYLSGDDLVKIGIMNRKQLMRFDEEETL